MLIDVLALHCKLSGGMSGILLTQPQKIFRHAPAFLFGENETVGFEKMLLHFAAPALCGIKSANLLSARSSTVDYECLASWNRLLAVSGRRIRTIRRSSGRLLIFIYDEERLSGLLAGAEALAYLASKGYPVGLGLHAMLGELFRRLASSPDFPHEIGLFLGYPLDDVLSFERDGGKSSSYCGMWQVYGNVELAVKQMERYRSCSERCCGAYDKGLGIVDIVVGRAF